MPHSLVSRFARHGLTLPALVLCVLAAVFVNEWLARETQRALQYGIRLTDANLVAGRLTRSLIEAQLELRAYANTGRDLHLHTFRRATAELDPELDQARKKFDAIGPQYATMMDAASSSVGAWRRDLQPWLSGEPVEPRERLNRLLDDPARQDLRDAARQDLAKALETAAAHRERTRVSLIQLSQMQRWVVDAMIVLTGLAAGILIRQIARAAEQRRLANLRLTDEVARQTALLRDLAGHLVSMQEQERSHIARELHDELGSFLTAGKLELARVRKVEGVPAAARTSLDRLDQHITQVIALKRNVIEALRPSSLEHLGLKMSVENLCESSATTMQIPVDCEIEDVDLSAEAQLAVFRLVQEALTNVAKYARAQHVKVRLTREGDAMRVVVQDDGRGFDPRATGIDAHGLRGMRIRVESLGGRLQVDSAHGQGTTVTALLPSRAPDAASEAPDAVSGRG